MFQSSRIASGSWRLQTSSACSPSSASSILNSRPSRMRLATLRMTLESSTTKQVFMAVPRLGLQLYIGSVAWVSCRHRIRGRDIEHAVDIEHHQQLPFQAINAGRDRGQARIEIDRVALEQRFVELENFADAVDEKTVGFAARFHADRHHRIVAVRLRQACLLYTSPSP